MKEFLLDLIFPKYCVGCKKFGDYICPNCFANIKFSHRSICAKCQKPSIDGLTHPICSSPNMIDGIVAGVEYRGIIKKIIYQLKYEPYLKSLATPCADLLYEALIQNEPAMMFVNSNTVVTSVPLANSRQRKRGYNQAEEIAKELCKKIDMHYVRMLKRTRDTKPQFDLKKEERLQNMKNAFSIENHMTSPRSQQSGRSGHSAIQPCFLIIDDVSTTGATLRECAKVLKRNGAKKVLGISFARE